jgi:hypothetical protein
MLIFCTAEHIIIVDNDERWSATIHSIFSVMKTTRSKCNHLMQ